MLVLDLKIQLEKNKNYTNYSSVFARLLLLNKELSKNNSFLIVVENDKILQNYLKISKFLGIELNELNNLSDLVKLTYIGKGKYIVTKDLFTLNLDSINQLEYKSIFSLKQKEKIDISEISKRLNELGYSYSEYENKNTFKILGDILSFTDNSGQNYKISFWGDEVDDIIIGKENLKELYIGENKDLDFFDSKKSFLTEIKDKIIEKNILLILDSLDFYSSYDKLENGISNYIIFNSLSNNKDCINLGINDLYIEKIDDLKNILEDKHYNKYIFTKNKQTIKNFLDLNNLEDVIIYETGINNLKSFITTKVCVITDDNISRIFVKKRIKRSLSKNLNLMMQIKPGDYIVHIDHGVGIFKEIIEKELSGIKKEYITLEYKNDDKLFVPITEVSRVSKYVGSDNPKLTGLSTKEWQKKLKKVSEDVELIAGELLETYAKRKLNKGFKFLSFPKEETKFSNSFEYVYTDDQLHIIKDIYKDMESENAMDRLLSGDVGFGKTEIAFASIFKSIINGKQAALISPLVVLAYEHYEKALSRFVGFPVRIGILTRFEKPSAISATLDRLKAGKIDLIIGTHRLLSQDIIFKDLGLLVVDEEHKFGVKDKEKITKFKGDIDILSMSATPIPRSLNMALNGIKDISMLTTPPIGRQSIQTVVSAFDDKAILAAGKREFDRKGQLFFIHNRVETIEAMGNYLSNIFPGKKITIAHGQLGGDRLEKRIIEFKRKSTDILLATTVVENGIDFPNVNTIFINEAQNFGISQIHQLRGRVGRSDKKGYCYLLFKKDKIKEDAAKRLKTIVDYSHLGAGFELAIKDLEVRGGGDVLGIRQSGQASEVGMNLFLEMLENKMEEMKKKGTGPQGNPLLKRKQATIDLNVGAYIDESFFSGELDKINFYREIESLDNNHDLETIVTDFKNINKDLPQTTLNFFNLLRLKLLATKHKIISIKKVGINYQIDFEESINLEELKKILKLDKEAKFTVLSILKLRTKVNNFANEEKFIEYMLQLFNDNVIKKKIKLKRKS